MRVRQIIMPELKVASARRVGPYGPEMGETFRRLATWACAAHVFQGKELMLGAYYDCPETTPPEKCRMDACVTLTPELNPALEEGVIIQTLPGGLYATILCDIFDNDFKGCWKEVMDFLAAKKALIDCRPCYEIYYGPCAETSPLKKWVLDICVPLKQKFS